MSQKKNKQNQKITNEDIKVVKQYLKLRNADLSKWVRHDNPKAHHSKACLDCFYAHNVNWFNILKQTKYLDKLNK